MTEKPQSKQVEVDESTEEKSVFVVDPDDYQKTRKLKAINDAKDYVRKLRQDRPNRAHQDEWKGIDSRISEAVAMYGNELLPLIEDALDQGVLRKEDLETEHGSLEEFVMYDGRIPNHDKGEFQDAKPFVYMAFYRQLERIQRQLGLGLELQENKGPASI